MVACARKRSRIAVAAGTSPRKIPQSCVGRFVVIASTRFHAGGRRFPKDPRRVRSELLHAEAFEHEQVDAFLSMSIPNVCEMMRAMRGQPNEDCAT
jgi:hypothetical protein